MLSKSLQNPFCFFFFSLFCLSGLAICLTRDETRLARFSTVNLLSSSPVPHSLSSPFVLHSATHSQPSSLAFPPTSTPQSPCNHPAPSFQISGLNCWAPLGVAMRGCELRGLSMPSLPLNDSSTLNCCCHTIRHQPCSTCTRRSISLIRPQPPIVLGLAGSQEHTESITLL